MQYKMSMNKAYSNGFDRSETYGIGVVDALVVAKIDYVASLSKIYKEILEDRWPSQYAIDAAIGYAIVLGRSEVEVDQLHFVLTR